MCSSMYCINTTYSKEVKQEKVILSYQVQKNKYQELYFQNEK